MTAREALAEPSTDDTPVEAEAAPPAWEGARVAGPWAIVEIMGHTVRAGSISDAVIAGTTMLRVQHPSVPDHEKAGPLTELYGPGSLFCVRPCSREEATRFAEARWRGQPRPVPVVAELAAVADAYVEEEDYVDEEPTGGW